MKRLFFVLTALAGVLLFAAPRANAQFTLVSGTVTDPNGLPWACGTISATLINNNGVSATLNGQIIGGSTAPVKLGCPTDATTSRTAGFFQMQLADNTVIKCGIVTCGTQTQWQFTVNTTGIAPPQGTGPQSLSQTFTISGSSQTLSFSNVPTLSIGAASTSALTGKISCLDVIPACVSDNTSLDATVNSGSNIVTCPDCNFLTTAAVGHIVQGGTNAAGIVLPITTIQSVDSNTQIHTVANATGTGAGTVYLAWGPDNTASLDALSNASVKVCKYGYLPAGFYFTQHAAFNIQNAGCSNSNAGRVGGLLGDAWINSKILMRYDFAFAGCTGGPASKACFGGPLALDMRSVAVDMMFNNTTLGAITYMFENNAGYWDRLGVSGVQGTLALTSNIVMCHFVGDEGVARESACVGGVYACLNDGRLTQLTVAPCLGAAVVGLFGNSGSYFSKGNFINATGAGANCAGLGVACAKYCASGAICHHENDAFNGGSVINAGTSFYKRVTTNIGGTSAGFTNTSGGVMSFQDTTSPATITNNSGATVVDEGNNTLSGTITNSGTWSGSVSITGSPCVSGNWALTSGWGTSSIASVTANGDSHRCQVVITGAAGAASPVLTWTFPKAYYVAPGSCDITFNGTLTGVSTGAPSTTAVAFTFNGTPSAQTYRLDASCGP